MSTITYRASAKSSGDGSSTLTIAKPSGVIAGDVMVAAIAVSGLDTLTAPTGWTLVRNTSANVRLATYYRVAGASEPGSYTWNKSGGNDSSGSIVAYSGANTAAPIVTSAGATGNGSPLVAPSVTTTAAGQVVLAAMSQGGAFDVTIQKPSETTGRSTYSSATIASSHIVADYEPASVGATGTKSSTTTGSGYPGYTAMQQVVLAPIPNVAPNAPILTAPADASTIDRTTTQRFDWDFSDPDAGDTQSAYNLRYRVVGAATWTETGWTSTPNTYHDIAGGTFADAVDYEWQVATKDAQGVEGPYSTSSFFTAANAPGGPTITAPVSGGTVEQFQTVEWSTPNQDAYQIQVLDGTTVTYDSGAMVSSTARSAVVEFPDNDVARTLQIRVEDGGLMSPWTAISVSVSYTPPPTPSLVAAASNADGAVSVTLTTPAAGVDEPTVEYVDLYVRDTTGQDKYRPAAGIRLAAQQLPNGVVIDWIAASGDNYEYQAVAVGDNGTTSASAWTAIDPDAVATVYYGGDY